MERRDNGGIPLRVLWDLETFVDVPPVFDGAEPVAVSYEGGGPEGSIVKDLKVLREFTDCGSKRNSK